MCEKEQIGKQYDSFNYVLSTQSIGANSRLYHYTNINSLAMILKNRSIKFGPLTTLDDLEEEKNIDVQKLSKYCFVSSWTDDEKESIPMWNMYSTLEGGIRIALERNPFKKYKINLPSRLREIGVGLEFVENSIFSLEESVLPEEEIINEKYSVFSNHKSKLLVKIKYTDDPSLLIPKIMSIENGKNVLTWRTGRYKNTYWSFQNEWRYILDFIPMGFIQYTQDVFKNGCRNLIRRYTNSHDLPFKNKFLHIDDDAFKSMEITLSPKITEGNRILTESIVERFNPSAIVRESDLINRIR